MPVETTYLPTEGALGQIGAARFLAVMAYPNKVKRRDRFIESVIDLIQREAAQEIAGRPRDINRHILRAEHEIKKRLPAAGLARRHLLRMGNVILTTTDQPVPTATTHHFARVTTGDEAAGHFYRDIWTPAKPVLHLMIAFENNAPGFMPEDGYGTADLIARPGWLHPALENAEALRGLIAACDAIEVSEGQTIQLLPAK